MQTQAYKQRRRECLAHQHAALLKLAVRCSTPAELMALARKQLNMHITRAYAGELRA